MSMRSAQAAHVGDALPGPGHDDIGAPGFAELWAAHAAFLFRKCLLWMRGNRTEAEEAFSRAALVATEKFPRDRDKIVNAGGWLMRLTYNVCMDLHREGQRHGRRFVLPHEGSDTLAPGHGGDTPETVYLAYETYRIVNHAIHYLPEHLRRPLELHVFQQMSFRDAAACLAITEVNLRKRMQRARSHILQCLGLRDAGDMVGVDDAPAQAWPASAGASLASPATLPRAVAVYRVAGGHGAAPAPILLAALPVRAPERALARLERYIERHPRGVRKRLELARVLMQLGRLDESAAALRLVIARNPRCYLAWFELAAVLGALGRAGELVDVYRAIIERVPSRATRAHFEAAWAVHERRLGDAAVALRMAVSAEPGNQRHWLALGSLHLGCGEPDKALRAFDAALALDPDDVVAMTLSLPALVALQRHAEARARVARVLVLAPDHALGHAEAAPGAIAGAHRRR